MPVNFGPNSPYPTTTMGQNMADQGIPIFAGGTDPAVYMKPPQMSAPMTPPGNPASSGPPAPAGGYSMDQWSALKNKMASYGPEAQKYMMEGLGGVQGTGGAKYDYLNQRMGQWADQNPMGGGSGEGVPGGGGPMGTGGFTPDGRPVPVGPPGQPDMNPPMGGGGIGGPVGPPMQPPGGGPQITNPNANPYDSSTWNLPPGGGAGGPVGPPMQPPMQGQPPVFQPMPFPGGTMPLPGSGGGSGPIWGGPQTGGLSPKQLQQKRQFPTPNPRGGFNPRPQPGGGRQMPPQRGGRGQGGGFEGGGTNLPGYGGKYGKGMQARGKGRANPFGGRGRFGPPPQFTRSANPTGGYVY